MADKESDAQAQVAGGEAADGQATPPVDEAKVIAQEALSIAKGTQGLYQKLMEAQRQTNDTLSVLAVGIGQGADSSDDEGSAAKPNPIAEQLAKMEQANAQRAKAEQEAVWCQNDVKQQLRLAGLKASDVAGMPTEAEWSQNYAAAWNASRAAIDAAHSKRSAKPSEEQVEPEIRSPGEPGGQRKFTRADVAKMAGTPEYEKHRDAIMAALEAGTIK